MRLYLNALVILLCFSSCAPVGQTTVDQNKHSIDDHFERWNLVDIAEPSPAIKVFQYSNFDLEKRRVVRKYGEVIFQVFELKDDQFYVKYRSADRELISRQLAELLLSNQAILQNQ